MVLPVIIFDLFSLMDLGVELSLITERNFLAVEKIKY